MRAESLEQKIQRLGGAVAMLRNGLSGPPPFPMRAEYSNWRDEQQAWSTTAVVFDQAHHMTDYKITRRTSVDDGALACTANHATFERMGWHSEMINGFPHWVPPSWADPDQRPRRNHLHD